METLKNVSFKPISQSFYYKPILMKYLQDGQEKSYEIAEKHSSVAILLYHTGLQKFLVVRQFRPPIFVNRVRKMAENHGKSLSEIQWEDYDAELGYTVELCAGMVDKDKSLEQIASEEIMEECGFSAKAEELLKIEASIYDLGSSGVTHNVYYVEVDDTRKIGEGGGNQNEQESITKVFLTLEEAEALSGCSPPGFSFAFAWWKNRNRDLKATSEPVLANKMREKVPNRMTNFSFTRDGFPKRDELLKAHFRLGRITRAWDLALRNDCVSVLLYLTDSEEVIFLKRFRPAAAIGRMRAKRENYGKKLEEIDLDLYHDDYAVTLEPMCTKLTQGETPQDAAIRAVLSQSGYKISNPEFIKEFIIGISMGGDMMKLYFAEATARDIDPNFREREDTTVLHLPKACLPELALYTEPLGPPILYYSAYYLLERLVW
ncbi:unnamed protein product, partial [Mesorhabditis spiculigera]